MNIPGRSNELTNLINYTNLDNLTMIEVGSYAGESAEIFVNTGKVKKIICIDPWLPNYDSNDEASSSDFVKVEAAFDNVMKKYENVIVKFKGTLNDFLKSSYDIQPDLIYIDACHTYEACKSDILNSVKLNPKFISGHDYIKWTPGVKRAVNEIFIKPDKVFSDSSWIVKFN